MENVRFNISPCSVDEVKGFIRKIDAKTYTPNGMVNATERSHYDRYSYLVGENKIAVVYDTSACILSITGRSDFAQALLDLFAPASKTVKRSTVPAQGSQPTPRVIVKQANDNATRAKLFVSPDSIRRRTEFAPVPTLFVSSKGAEISTDEIYPPQTIKKRGPAPAQANVAQDGDVIYPPQVAKKRVLPSYGETRIDTKAQQTGGTAQKMAAPFNGTRVQAVPQVRTYEYSAPVRTEKREEQSASDYGGLAISVGHRSRTDSPRISFGTEDNGRDDGALLKINTRPQQPQPDQPQQTEKRKRGRPPKNAAPSPAQQPQQTEKRKRGRPPKNKNDEPTADIVSTPEYKNGYSVKNFPFDALDGALNRLKSYGKKVAAGETEFSGTVQEVKNYTVTDAQGQKVLLRYATKRMTLQLQGKRSNLFGEVMSQVSNYSDYSSALENYVEESGSSGHKVSDVQNKLKKRLPTAFEYLSEQSRIDFSYGIHDFSQSSLHLSDYSVLLVPAFRGLERFVFDLQCSEGIKVKMIGQAFDKDDSGRYILKSGYTQRMKSVIYPEVLAALYSEYFAQRNFFAHSDNTDSNISRSIPERAAAQKIFEHLLDVVEYNSKKLKEIGYKINNQTSSNK